MLPDRNTAEELLRDAGQCNPGAWVNHSKITARCAEQIAKACAGMDSEKSYIVAFARYRQKVWRKTYGTYL